MNEDIGVAVYSKGADPVEGAPFALRLWAHTEEFPDNRSVGLRPRMAPQ